MANVAASQVPLWGIRAGRGDEAYEMFTKDGVVALAWPGTPDLAALPDDREAFKQVYRQTFPERSDGNVVTGASQLYRFVHEMQVGDLVAYPSKRDRHVHLGRVESDYRFAPEAPYRFCHQRRVQWLKRVPRTSYSQGVLFELGSALTLFQVRNYLDEHLAALGEVARARLGLIAERGDGVPGSSLLRRAVLRRPLARDGDAESAYRVARRRVAQLGVASEVADDGG